MDARPETHPADDQLQALASGRLDAGTAGPLNEHLSACPDCRQRVAALRGAGPTGTVPAAGVSDRTPAPADAAPPTAAAGAAAVPDLAGLPGYEIVKELGRGGMGVVYLARNKLMDRYEVLKVMSKALVGKPAAVDRFLQEIRSAGRLVHANVATAYSAHQLGDLLVLAMEYVEGDDLAKVARERGPLPIAQACFCVYQAAVALQRAHELGMVHRDIKPANLLLSRQGKRAVVKVIDFGLAKAKAEVPTERGLTGLNQMMGTPGYTAPEQLNDAKNADIRADIYGLGATLYCLLAGEPAFQGNSVFEILIRQQAGTVRPLREVRPEVPEPLAQAVARMLAKDAADRFREPVDVARALTPFIKGTQVFADPPPAQPAPPAPPGETVSPGARNTWHSLPPGDPAAAPGAAGPAEVRVVECPDCHASLNLPAGFVGKRVKCKKCGGRFVVGAPAGSSPTGTAVTLDDAGLPLPPPARPKTVSPAPKSLPAVTVLPAGDPRTAAGPGEPVFDVLPADPPAPRRRSRLALVAALAGAVLVLGGGGAAYFLLNQPVRNQPPALPRDSRVAVTPPPSVTPPATARPAPVPEKRDPPKPEVAAKKREPAPRPEPARLTKEQLADLEGPDPARCGKAIEDLAGLPPEEARRAVPALFRAAARHEELRGLAIREIDRRGRPRPGDQECLARAVESSHVPVRLCAVRTLGRMGADAEVPLLMRALGGDSEPAVRVAAAAALGGLPPAARQEAFEELLSAAGSKDDDVSRAALTALARPTPLAGKQTEQLSNALRNPTGRIEVRRLAAAVLGRQGPSARGAVGDLCSVLRDKTADEGLLLLSVGALTQIGDRGEQTVRTLRGRALPGPDEKAPERVRLAALDALATLDPSAVSTEEILRQREADPSEAVKGRLAQLLDRRLQTLRAGDLTTLQPLLKSGDPDLARRALAAIVRVKSVRGVAGDVVALASNRDDAVRQQALKTLDAVGPAAKEAVLALKALLTGRGKDLSREGRMAVAVTLARADPRDPDLAAVVVPPLLDGIHDPGPDGRPKVRQQVTKLLTGYGQPALDAVFDYFDHRVDFRSNQSAADYREELYRLVEGLGKDHPSPANYDRVKRLQQREIAKKATNYTNMMAALNDALEALGAAGKR